MACTLDAAAVAALLTRAGSRQSDLAVGRHLTSRRNMEHELLAQQRCTEGQQTTLIICLVFGAASQPPAGAQRCPEHPLS